MRLSADDYERVPGILLLKKIRAFAPTFGGEQLAERGAPGDVETAGDLLTNAHARAAANGGAGVERRA